jgi:hypothetical protein
MDKTEYTQWNGIIDGGSFNNGKQLWFTVQMNTDEQKTFVMDCKNIQQLIASFSSYASTAAKEREDDKRTIGQERSFIEISEPRFALPFDPDKIAVKMQTHYGLPIELLIDRQSAKQIADGLVSWLTSAEPNQRTA